jgi:alcohol dehydrogenase (cytochrome c)
MDRHRGDRRSDTLEIKARGLLGLRTFDASPVRQFLQLVLAAFSHAVDYGLRRLSGVDFRKREDLMTKRNNSIRIALLASSVLAMASSAFAADVTPERLLNPDQEPQNWLMNHRTYDGQRFSPLARINKGNIKGLRLVYAVPLGGLGGNEWNEATPLVENGFLYITDSWGVLYKIDGTSGDVGRVVWRMDPKQEKQGTNRGAAFWGNLVISPANWPARIVATDKETGNVVWETNMVFGQAETRITAAPLALKDKIIVGASGGDSGVRDWIAGLDAATGRVLWRKFTIPAPGEPGSETWKGANNAWQTGGGAVWVTGTYDPDTNQTIWGTGNPVPMFDPFYRPGDNLYTDFLGPRVWQYELVLPVHTGRHVGL